MGCVCGLIFSRGGGVPGGVSDGVDIRMVGG